MYRAFMLYAGDFCLTPDSCEFITEVSGINPLASNLISVTPYNYIGAVYQGATKGTRNIVLSIEILKKVNENRESILAVIQSGESVALRFVVGDDTFYIDGVVESIEYNRFEAPKRSRQVVQVSIICFEPYFRGETVTIRSASNPKVIEYASAITTGFIYEISGNEYGSSLLKDTFYILKGDEELSLTTDIEAKKIIINTATKEIQIIDTSDNVRSGRKYLNHGSTWIQLEQGTNTIRFYQTWGAEAQTSITYSPKYDKI